jgi:CIC family chloride channel protein
MCACLGAVVRAPVTGILIVFEMTHDFALVPALMLGALVSQSISRLFAKENFYDALLSQDGNHIERIMPLRSLRSWMELPVARIANFSPVVVRDLAPESLRELLATHRFERFPVLEGNKLAGVLARSEAEAAIAAGRAPRLDAAVTCAAEMPVRQIESLLIEAPGHVVIVTEKKPGESDELEPRVIGLVTLHDILRAEIMHAREHETE